MFVILKKNNVQIISVIVKNMFFAVLYFSLAFEFVYCIYRSFIVKIIS
jgi:hypothetical protein